MRIRWAGGRVLSDTAKRIKVRHRASRHSCAPPTSPSTPLPSPLVVPLSSPCSTAAARVTMAAAAPDYQRIGAAFVAHYYNVFDTSRPSLAPLYVRFRCCLDGCATGTGVQIVCLAGGGRQSCLVADVRVLGSSCTHQSSPSWFFLALLDTLMHPFLSALSLPRSSSVCRICVAAVVAADLRRRAIYGRRSDHDQAHLPALCQSGPPK